MQVSRFLPVDHCPFGQVGRVVQVCISQRLVVLEFRQQKSVVDVIEINNFRGRVLDPLKD